MIYTAEHFAPDRQGQHPFKEIVADVCVVGSGAGGARAALQLADAGLKVVVLEAGSFLTPKDFSQREEDMFPKLFFESGGRRTQDKSARILHGKGVGGSTLHNVNLCKKPPQEIIDQWQLGEFNYTKFFPMVEQIWRELGVELIGESDFNQNNILFKKGTEQLGWKGGPLHHNRRGCLQSGFCELGCRFNAKLNALRVYIPALIKKGGMVLADTVASDFEFQSQKATMLRAYVGKGPAPWKNGTPITIKAQHYFLAGGAIETPLLYLRSKLPDPYQVVGKKLRLHPGGAVSGIFSEEVRFWEGIPQSYECMEFLDFSHRPGGISSGDEKRVWLVGTAAHPIGVAGIMPGFGPTHRKGMELFPHIASISAMVHDQSEGRVSLSTGPFSSPFLPKIEYSMDLADKQQMDIGLAAALRILIKAGAKEVRLPARQEWRWSDEKDLLNRPPKFSTWPLLDMDIVSVHPMGSMAMGLDPKTSVCNPQGKIHQMENMWVADGSLYPTSLGIPPQITTYSMGLWVSTQFLKNK